MGALMTSMLGIVAAIVVQWKKPDKAYLYIINIAWIGGTIAWLISLLAHVRFRLTTPREQLQKMTMVSPLGATGSIVGFVAIIAAIVGTSWVSQSSIAAKSAGIYFAALTLAYFAADLRRLMQIRKLPKSTPDKTFEHRGTE
jgi:L-asparagine transporter-like permease